MKNFISACFIRARNARELIQFALEHQPDLIVTDNRMPPGMTGEQALAIILPQLPHTCAIIATGTPEDITSFRGFVVDKFAPNMLSDFLRALNSLF